MGALICTSASATTVVTYEGVAEVRLTQPSRIATTADACTTKAAVAAAVSEIDACLVEEEASLQTKERPLSELMTQYGTLCVECYNAYSHFIELHPATVEIIEIAVDYNTTENLLQSIQYQTALRNTADYIADLDYKIKALEAHIAAAEVRLAQTSRTVATAEERPLSELMTQYVTLCIEYSNAHRHFMKLNKLYVANQIVVDYHSQFTPIYYQNAMRNTADYMANLDYKIKALEAHIVAVEVRLAQPSRIVATAEAYTTKVAAVATTVSKINDCLVEKEANIKTKEELCGELKAQYNMLCSEYCNAYRHNIELRTATVKSLNAFTKHNSEQNQHQLVINTRALNEATSHVANLDYKIKALEARIAAL